jgi:predicted DNA-binding protein (MmcQ/YjbR family)
MNLETFRNYCLDFNSVTEEFPFDKTTLVFKVHGKIFALLDIEKFDSINLKCDPERSIELREQYNGVLPGYHMNKKHWNTITLNSDLNDEFIFDLTKHSYNLVFSSLPKKIKEKG